MRPATLAPSAWGARWPVPCSASRSLVGRLGRRGPFVDGLHAARASGCCPSAALRSARRSPPVLRAWRWQPGRRARSALPCRCARPSPRLPRAVPQHRAARRGARRRAPRRSRHGRDAGTLGPACGPSCWERAPGRSSRSCWPLAVLLVLPSPVRPASVRWSLAAVAAASSAAACCAVAWAPGAAASAGAGIGAVRRAAGRSRWPGIAARPRSLAVGGYVAHLPGRRPRRRGRRARSRRCCRSPLLVLLAMAVPLNLGRLGPARGRGGLGLRRRRARGGTGLAAAVAYGVLSSSRPCPARLVLAAPGRRTGARDAGHPACRRGRSRPWLTAPTPCSAAACRSTATSTAPARTRLVLSNAADLDRVDEVRAGSDAILVGAATVRDDDPRLLVREPGAGATGAWSRGRPPSPAKVTVTARGRLDPAPTFFADRRRREARLLRGAAPCAAARDAARRAWRPSSTAAGRATMRGLRERPVRPRRPPADGRGRRHRAHPVPHRRPRRRAAPRRRPVLRRRPRGHGGSSGTGASLDASPARTPGRGTPDRRRGAAALRAVRPVRTRRGGVESSRGAR